MPCPGEQPFSQCADQKAPKKPDQDAAQHIGGIVDADIEAGKRNQQREGKGGVADAPELVP